MDKNTTIAFILIGVILVLWLYLNAPERQPVDLSQRDTTEVLETEPLVVDTIVQEENVEDVIEEESDLGIFAKSGEEERILSIENDLVKLELTSKGARIRRYYLKDHHSWYYNQITDTTDFYRRHVQLINHFDGGDLNLVFVSKEGKLVNTADLDFKTDEENYYIRISGNDSVTIKYYFDTGNSQVLAKVFTFYGNNYMSKVDIELDNMHEVISGMRYDFVWSNGITFVEENSAEESEYANASAFSGGEQVIIDASSVGEVEKKTITGKVDWIGVRNKYFAVIIDQDNPDDEGGARFEGRRSETETLGVREYYNSSLIIPFNQTKYQKNTFNLFIGPMDYNLLKSYGKNFDAFYDFGSFFGLSFITRPISEYVLLPLFKFIHLFIPNYGFVIIVFSIIIKIALYPLTRQSYKSMRKMQRLQPKISELKEKFKGDQQRIQKETMKLYQTYGINPAGGCLPMVLQMPILFALFTFFRVTIEIRHEPFMFWITNLSSPDYILQLPFKIPLFNIDKITGLAPLLGITMFMQQKMSVKDPSQKALVYVMPIMFTLLFMGFSSGLNLYYFMFNLLSIMQQYYINHKKGDNDELVPVKNPKKKKSGGFMQRMMEAAEKQSQAQKQGPKKKRKF
ncbi:membrane protein insertase YidC [Bacteroidota bacterium]